MAPRHGHRTRGQAAMDRQIIRSGKIAAQTNATDDSRLMHLRALEQLFAQKSGIRSPTVDLTTGQPIQEQPGHAETSYVPAGVTDQQNRGIYVDRGGNPAGPRDQLFGTGAKPALGGSPTAMLRAGAEYGQQSMLAHETGHIAEPDVVRNLARARMVQEAQGMTWDPRTALLGRSPQGRAEMRVAPVQRDQWGLALEGAKPGIHQAPNELYAEDTAQALGYDRGRPLGEVRQLAHRGLVPHPQPWMAPANPAFARLAELGIDHTTMPSLSPTVGGGVMRKR